METQLEPGLCPVGLADNPSEAVDAALEALRVMSLAHRHFFFSVTQSVGCGEDGQGEANCLTPQEMMVLTQIVHGSSSSPSDLAKSLAIARPNVTSILNHLKERGLLEVHAHATDKRRQELQVTQAGKTLLQEMVSGRKERMRQLFAAFTQEELEELRDSAKRMTQLIGRLG